MILLAAFFISILITNATVFSLSSLGTLYAPHTHIKKSLNLFFKGKITIDGTEYFLGEGDSIVMPARHPHVVYGEEQFKMLLVVVF